MFDLVNAHGNKKKVKTKEQEAEKAAAAAKAAEQASKRKRAFVDLTAGCRGRGNQGMGSNAKRLQYTQSGKKAAAEESPSLMGEAKAEEDIKNKAALKIQCCFRQKAARSKMAKAKAEKDEEAEEDEEDEEAEEAEEDEEAEQATAAAKAAEEEVARLFARPKLSSPLQLNGEPIVFVDTFCGAIGGNVEVTAGQFKDFETGKNPKTPVSLLAEQDLRGLREEIETLKQALSRKDKEIRIHEKRAKNDTRCRDLTQKLKEMKETCDITQAQLEREKDRRKEADFNAAPADVEGNDFLPMFGGANDLGWGAIGSEQQQADMKAKIGSLESRLKALQENENSVNRQRTIFQQVSELQADYAKHSKALKQEQEDLAMQCVQLDAWFEQRHFHITSGQYSPAIFHVCGPDFPNAQHLCINPNTLMGVLFFAIGFDSKWGPLVGKYVEDVPPKYPCFVDLSTKQVRLFDLDTLLSEENVPSTLGVCLRRLPEEDMSTDEKKWDNQIFLKKLENLNNSRYEPLHTALPNVISFLVYGIMKLFDHRHNYTGWHRTGIRDDMIGRSGQECEPKPNGQVQWQNLIHSCHIIVRLKNDINAKDSEGRGEYIPIKRILKDVQQARRECSQVIAQQPQPGANPQYRNANCVEDCSRYHLDNVKEAFLAAITKAAEKLLMAVAR